MLPSVEQSQKKYVLAIDLGSGGPKVALVDQDGVVIASHSVETHIYILPNGGGEQDPHEWWSAVVSATKKVVQAAALDPQAIVGISCTGQYSVIVPVDEHGDPLMNAVHWTDTRGAPYNKAIVQGAPELQGMNIGKLVTWMKKVGFPPTLSGVDSLGHILFIQHERPEVYRKTYKFLEPVDYINLRLTGRCAATLNTLFAYGLTDNRKLDSNDYDAQLVQMAGIDKAKLPEILPVDGILGPLTPSVASELGLSPKTVVVTGANDNSTSAIGSGAVADFETSATLGTSGYLGCHVPFKKTDLVHFISTMASSLPNRYLIFSDMGSVSGRVIESFLNNMVYANDEFSQAEAPADKYERLNQIAGQVAPGSEGLLFLPWFKGTLCPAEDPYVRGGFLNLSHSTTRAHMTRSVLEGIALNYRWLHDPAEKFIGHPMDHWRLSGGGALSDVWVQIMADVVGIPMHQLANPRLVNATGAAFLAFNRLGLLPLEEIPSRVQIAKVVMPREEYRPLYEKLYQQFMAAFKQIRPIFHALNK
jgi:xylulokinase